MRRDLSCFCIPKRSKSVGRFPQLFALGGHSLLGARLFAQLDEEFGRALPLSILLATPTVRKLAEFLRAAKPLDGCVSLVPITLGSSRPPVFAVPGVGGNVIGYAELARALGPDQGFFALQSVGLDGSREPLESIEDMARLYVAEVRSVRPRGPYAIIGACFGATVAYEMARQIIRGGQEVAFLGLLDPTSMGGEDAARPLQPLSRVLMRARVAGVFVKARSALYLSELGRLAYRERLAYIGRKAWTFLRRMGGRGSLDGARIEMAFMMVEKANLAALRRFERKPIDGRVGVVAIFETRRRATRAADARGWMAAGGEFVRCTVAGKDSGDMLKADNAKTLATDLARYLTKALDQG